MFKSFLPRIALALSLPAIGALALSATAQANVRSSTPGSACQFGTEEGRSGVPFDPAAERFQSSYTPEHGLWYLKTNTSTTGSTSALSVQCPVVRNLPLSTAGLSDLEVRFRSYGLDVPIDVYCTAYSMRTDGSIIDSHQKFVTINPSQPVPGTIPGTPGSIIDHIVSMDFGNAIGASASKGTYGLDCSLPPGVGLMSIYSSEVDGINNN